MYIFIFNFFLTQTQQYTHSSLQELETVFVLDAAAAALDQCLHAFEALQGHLLYGAKLQSTAVTAELLRILRNNKDIHFKSHKAH